MNLIKDAWIPVIRADGAMERIAPWQLTESQNPVMEINAPRPDFQGALYQFIIGLLQTCFAPEDEDIWQEYWETPSSPEDLKKAFSKAAFAFELNNPEGIAFLQDYDLPDGECKSIAGLLIDAPGGKTIKDNLDHFIKGGRVNQLCPSCTAAAIFTLQTNAPSGGSGHRVGLRGGGPLTTLLMPKEDSATLWQKCWLNIFDQEEKLPIETLGANVFPWLAETRISNKGQVTTPLDTHWLQAYWGMPRRIRLSGRTVQQQCDLCGHFEEQLFTEYRTKNHGVNYDGAWLHPLTPYRFDPKSKELPLSLKGQQGGLVYRHWLGLALQDNENGDKAAEIVQFFNNERGRELNSEMASIWCFGYDMDNMKARCWYESRFPLFYLSEQQQNNLMFWAAELIAAAREAVKILRSQVKEAWFKRPKDTKGDMSVIDRHFWEETERDFFRLLEQLAHLPGETGLAPPEVYRNWYAILQQIVFRIFENETIASVPEDLDLKRIIAAKNNLRKRFYNNKAIKNLKIKMQEEAA
jgi:CRISPR system Cascade subunit CasA